jgi:hypothetical protein
MRPITARFLCALVAVASLPGCSRTTSPPQWFADSRAANGEITVQGATALRCVTTQGTVSAEGEGLGGVRWHLSEHVVGPTRERANQALDQFAVTHSRTGDTLVFDVVTPAAADVYATADVSLGIPFGMDLIVENAAASVYASDLRGLFRVRGSRDVTVERHTGSCDVAIGSGSVALEVAVPDSGACVVSTGDGSIDVRLPAATSAVLTARTARGIVNVSGLTLAARVDSAGYVAGTLGAGAATIRLETRRGNITVTALP